LDFEGGKSPQDELRMSFLRGVRRRIDDGGDFCRVLLLINELFLIGDGERRIYLRVLFGVKRFFDNDDS
jgi:hypothetical protein